MNGYHLPEAVNSHVWKDVVINRDASYRNAEFFIALAGSESCVFAIHFQRLNQGDAQGLKQTSPGGLLTINTGHLFNPTDPPSTVLFYNGR